MKHKLSLYGYNIISKEGITLEPTELAFEKNYHAHLLYIGTMYSKSHLDDILTVEGVWGIL